MPPEASEEIDKAVWRKYDVQAKLGKGVRFLGGGEGARMEAARLFFWGAGSAASRPHLAPPTPGRAVPE